MSQFSFDVVVVGAGAAGYFAAVTCAERYPHLRIAILEKNSKALQKVLVSGGGRCNVTHSCFDNKKLVEHYPRGGKKLLTVFKQFNPSNTIEWFQQHGVNLVAEADGRMFPSTNQSSTIIKCLCETADALGIQVKLRTELISIHVKEDSSFELNTSEGVILTNRLILTTGGSPKREAYEFIKNIGVLLKPPIPSLFTFNILHHPLVDLMGVSLPHAEVKIPDLKLSSKGSLLITHWGFSGPCIIKLSAFAAEELFRRNYEYQISISWIGTRNTDAVIQSLVDFKIDNAAKNIENAVPMNLPKRLWLYLIQWLDETPDKKWSDVSLKFIRKLSEKLCNDIYQAKGKTTFKEEFVTCGGVKLDEVNLESMQHQRIKNLFFAGEVLDIDGVTGGFNFQAAWSTAFVAAKLGLSSIPE
jgi:predicted Rossmann fold flavoprotein